MCVHCSNKSGTCRHVPGDFIGKDNGDGCTYNMSACHAQVHAHALLQSAGSIRWVSICQGACTVIWYAAGTCMHGSACTLHTRPSCTAQVLHTHRDVKRPTGAQFRYSCPSGVCQHKRSCGVCCPRVVWAYSALQQHARFVGGCHHGRLREARHVPHKGTRTVGCAVQDDASRGQRLGSALTTTVNASRASHSTCRCIWL